MTMETPKRTISFFCQIKLEQEPDEYGSGQGKIGTVRADALAAVRCCFYVGSKKSGLSEENIPTDPDCLSESIFCVHLLLHYSHFIEDL